MLLSLMLINQKQKIKYNANAIDIDRLIDIHPDNWYLVENGVTSPAWLSGAKIDYDKVSARTYRNSEGKEITIVMTWSQNGLLRPGHVQQLCYSSQGFSITGQKYIDVPVKFSKIKVTNFMASNINGQVEDVYYWRITDGKLMDNIEMTRFEDQVLSHRILRMKEIIKNIFVKVPDNIMVRVSSRMTRTDKSDNISVIYINEYLQKLSPQDIKLITGL